MGLSRAPDRYPGPNATGRTILYRGWWIRMSTSTNPGEVIGKAFCRQRGLSLAFPYGSTVWAARARRQGARHGGLPKKL